MYNDPGDFLNTNMASNADHLIAYIISCIQHDCLPEMKYILHVALLCCGE